MASTPPLQKSGASSVNQSQASIYTMPEQFLALTRAKEMPRQAMPLATPTEPQHAVLQPASTVTPASTPKPAVGGIEQPTESGMRKTLILWGAIGGGLLILGGIAAFFVLRSVPAQAPVNASTNVAPTNTTPPPPPPVNQEPPAPANVAPVVEPLPPVDEPVPPNVDRDEDGLTDAEENVLGTDVSVRDTDSDGFDDRTELLNLYNPTGIAPQKILDAGLVFEYENPSYGWKIFVPKAWAIAATDQEQREVIISTPAPDERIIVRVQEHEADISLQDFVKTTIGAVVPVTTKRGMTMYRVQDSDTPSRIVAFPLTSTLIATIEYESGEGISSIRFPGLFEMMIQSFATVGSR